MQPLVIRIEDVESGEAWIYVRADSPVLLGRGEGASLRIGRPFVSQAHGVFTFDEARGGWSYADLDSASPTLLADRALEPEEVVPVAPSSVLRVGTLALTVLAEAPPDRDAAAAEAADAASPFAAGQPRSDTAPLPVIAVVAAPPASAPAGAIAGGTMLLPASLQQAAARPAQRPPAAAISSLPIEPPRARVRRVAVVALGAVTVSALVTWLLVRPSARPIPEPPRSEPTTAFDRDDLRQLPPKPPARPPAHEAPDEAPDEAPAPPPAAAHAKHAPPRPKHHAPHAEKPRRGANGAMVIE